MDQLDREIVTLLMDHGRLSHEEIGQRINLSRPAVHERIKRLEQKGIITGYNAVVDWTSLGYPITAFIWVSSNARSDDKAQALMQQKILDVVIESCHSVTGEWCLYLYVHVTSPLALKNFIDSLYKIEGVQNTMTILSLAEYHHQPN
jgi:Lrp/AsnC family leucine-responsive transcriptional regulator